MYITVISGSTEYVSDQLSQISALQDRLDSSEFSDSHTTHHKYHTFKRKVNLPVFFSLFFHEKLLSRRPTLSPVKCSSYSIIPPGIIFKNLVLSQSQIDLRILHVSRKKQLQFP